MKLLFLILISLFLFGCIQNNKDQIAGNLNNQDNEIDYYSYDETINNENDNNNEINFIKFIDLFLESVKNEDEDVLNKLTNDGKKNIEYWLIEENCDLLRDPLNKESSCFELALLNFLGINKRYFEENLFSYEILAIEYNYFEDNKNLIKVHLRFNYKIEKIIRTFYFIEKDQNIFLDKITLPLCDGEC